MEENKRMRKWKNLGQWFLAVMLTVSLVSVAVKPVFAEENSETEDVVQTVQGTEEDKAVENDENVKLEEDTDTTTYYGEEDIAKTQELENENADKDDTGVTVDSAPTADAPKADAPKPIQVVVNLGFDINNPLANKAMPYTATITNPNNEALENIIVSIGSAGTAYSFIGSIETQEGVNRKPAFEDGDYKIDKVEIIKLNPKASIQLKGTITVRPIYGERVQWGVWARILNADGSYVASGGSEQYVLEYPEKIVSENENIRESIVGDAELIDFDSSDSEALYNYLFTPGELAAGGTVTWSVASCSVDSIPAQSKEAIFEKAGTKDIAMVLDINCWAKAGANSRQITELPAYLARTITINVPEEYRDANRVFTVIRLHNGTAEELTDLDNDPNTVTISTDKFSYYALAYEDQEPGTGTKPNAGVKPGAGTKPVAAATGDIADVKASLAICVLMAGVIAVMVILRKKKIV